MAWFISSLVLGFGIIIGEEFYCFIVVEVIEYCYFLCGGCGYISFVRCDGCDGIGIYINLCEMFGKFVSWCYLFCVVVKYVFVGDGIICCSCEGY